MKYYYQ